MMMKEIRRVYPEAGRIIWRLVDDGLAIGTDVEALSDHALARIDRGETTERDLVRLLSARAAMRRKQV